MIKIGARMKMTIKIHTKETAKIYVRLTIYNNRSFRTDLYTKDQYFTHYLESHIIIMHRRASLKKITFDYKKKYFSHEKHSILQLKCKYAGQISQKFQKFLKLEKH